MKKMKTMTMKTLPKRIMLAAVLGATVLQPVYAGGIPVFDGTAISQSVINSLKELAEMAKQLQEAKNQLVELKKQVNALTGDKGFSETMRLGGLDETLQNTFGDLLKGNTGSLIEKKETYLGKGINCDSDDSVTQSLCESSTLSNVSMLDYIDKLGEQYDIKLKKIEELSEKIKQTEDMKGIAELQAAIALEGNSIAILQQQTQTFRDLNDTRQRMAAQKALIKSSSAEFRQFNKEHREGSYTSKNNKGCGDLLGK